MPLIQPMLLQAYKINKTCMDAVYSDKREVVWSDIFHDTGVITRNSVNGLHDDTALLASYKTRPSVPPPPPPHTHTHPAARRP